jgi:hypothetical protein
MDSSLQIRIVCGSNMRKGRCKMSSEPKRVVQIEPGDLLVVSNVGPLSQQEVELMNVALVNLDIQCLIFSDQVELSHMDHQTIQHLAKESEARLQKSKE